MLIDLRTAKDGCTRRDAVLGMGAASTLLAAPGAIAAPAAEDAAPKRFEAVRSATINGARVDYRVISGETNLVNPAGAVTGSIFSFSYLRENVADRDTRPVMFIFNGGPGSSSVWLHLGVMGPRTVRLDRDVNPSVIPPFALENNGACLLDIADLVFIDPVGTGFSRIRGEGKNTDFYGLDEDAASVAQFIDLWLSEHDRWLSPKYLLGESYGTVRAAMIQRFLMGGPNYGGALRAISLNGIILVGSVFRPMPLSDASESAIMVLPNMAATAWFHGKVNRTGRTLEAFVNEVFAFAEGPYAQALRAGTRLPAAERDAVAQKLADYVGLPKDAVLRANLRLSNRHFGNLLLEAEGVDVGLYDSRYTLPHSPAGIALDPVGDDPAMARYTPGFAAAWHRYMLRDLNIRMDRPYGTIVWSGIGPWNYERKGVPNTQSYAVDLALAMRRNPDLRMLVMSGYYDLVTPIMTSETALAEAGTPLDRVRFTRYESGHMSYFGGTAPAFLRDIRGFLQGGGRTGA